MGTSSLSDDLEYYLLYPRPYLILPTAAVFSTVQCPSPSCGNCRSPAYAFKHGRKSDADDNSNCMNRETSKVCLRYAEFEKCNAAALRGSIVASLWVSMKPVIHSCL